MNASANLTLIKARQQLGIPRVTGLLLVAYIVATLIQVALPGFASAVLVRGICGLAAAGLTTMTLYNLLQVVPPAKRPVALLLTITIPQFSTPIARLVPVEMLTLGGWQGLHLIELGLALASLAAITLLPIPPSERSQAFEPFDFVTIALVIPAMLLLCIVLGVGRYLWWTDTPWLGWALAACVPLFAAALVVEARRERPLLQLGWIGSRDMLRFAIVALLIRLALAEQTYGAIGLLTAGGLNNDQLHLLFVFVMLAMVAGAVVALLTMTPTRLGYQVVVAALVIALGAWLDSSANNLTRPPELYLSQALIGFGTCLFIGPSLIFGFLQMLAKGPNHLISFMVVFSTTQNVGGLAGSALLGTYQVAATRAHAQAISDHLVAADPAVAARLQGGAGALVQSMTREATILAYDDVFRLVAIIALLTAAYLSYILFYNRVWLPHRTGSASGR